MLGASWRVAGAAVLVVVACGACSGGSGSTSVTPALGADQGGSGSASATATQPGGAAGSPGSGSPTGGTSTSTGGPGSGPRPGVGQPGSQPASPGAIGLVKGYYAAIASHDASAALQYLSPEYLAGFGGRSAFSAWIANYRSLTGLTVRASRPPSGDVPPQHPGYRDLAVLPISYVAQVRAPSANETSGAQDRFVLVGRSATGATWLILDIATSP